MMKSIKNQMLYVKMQYHALMIGAYEEHFKKGRFPDVCFKKITDHFMKMMRLYADLVKDDVVPMSPKIMNSLNDLEQILNKK